MVSVYDVGVRLLKYTGYTFFTYIIGFTGVFVLLYFDLVVFNPFFSFTVLVLVFNLLLYLYSHRNLDAFENSRLELSCAVLPVIITPLGGYIIGGILMTLEGPPLRARKELN